MADLQTRGYAVSDSAEPVEALIAVIGSRASVRDLDRRKPFGVLEAELSRCAQPQRISKRIRQRLTRVFGRQNGLRMQRCRHIKCLGVAIGTAERDVARAEV